MHVLVTGAAGFIGYHLTLRLLADGHDVTGIDNLNDYYDVQLKKDRVASIASASKAGKHFRFVRLDLADNAGLEALFTRENFTYVVNMAAQAGVRYSLQNPAAYISTNLTGFGHLLECCRNHNVVHLIFASSSSVYGLNTQRPYSVRHNTDHPASLYAATKKSNELMAHAYSHLYRLPCTGVRLFTVYGPWGRPDMAPHIFAAAIVRGRELRVFNEGRMCRDFTYIDDAVEALARLVPLIPTPDTDFDTAAPNPAASSAPWRVHNIGNNTTVELNTFISLLEEAFGQKVRKTLLPMQPGDLEATFADINDMNERTGFAPKTHLREGIARFAAWYREYYKS